MKVLLPQAKAVESYGFVSGMGSGFWWTIVDPSHWLPSPVHNVVRGEPLFHVRTVLDDDGSVHDRIELEGKTPVLQLRAVVIEKQERRSTECLDSGNERRAAL